MHIVPAVPLHFLLLRTIAFLSKFTDIPLGQYLRQYLPAPSSSSLVTSP